MANEDRAEFKLAAAAGRPPGASDEQIAALARAFGRSAEDAAALQQKMHASINRDVQDLNTAKESPSRAAAAALEACRTHARRRRLERGAADELRRQGLPVAGESFGQDVPEMSVKLEAALAQLERPGAEVLRMSSLGGMSCSALAGILELSSESAEESIVRARKKLAALLRPEAPEELYAEHVLHAEEQRRALWLASPSLTARLSSASRQLLRSLFRVFSQET